MDIHKGIGKLPILKGGYTLPNHKYTGPYNPLEKQLDLNDNPLPGQRPFNAVDKISLKHDIFYRDNDSKDGKTKCDKLELEVLDPKSLREKIDRNLVKQIITTKYRLGLGIKWTNELANELQKPVRKKFKKRHVFVKGANAIWAADLADMTAFSKFNQGYKYILTVIDVFSKYGYAIHLETKTAQAVTTAFKKLFKEDKPLKLWTDRGTEFYNKSMKELLSKNNITLYPRQNQEKSCVVGGFERLNQKCGGTFLRIIQGNI